MTALLLAALCLNSQAPADAPPARVDAETCLARVRAIHGGTGPWAVAGYRIGERALAELSRPRNSFAIAVVHRSPAEVQFSCVADGVQAATGASPGKLNLKLEEATREGLATVITDRETGRSLTFRIRPDLARSILDLPLDRLEAEGRRVASLPDDELFEMQTVDKAGRRP